MANKVNVTAELKKELDTLMHSNLSSYKMMNEGQIKDTYDASWKDKHYTITRKDMPAKKVAWWKYFTQIWDKDAEFEIRAAKPTSELCAWEVTGELIATRRIETSALEVEDPEERKAIRYSLMKSLFAALDKAEALK